MSSIRDVAELAQVSTATVSHVANGTRYVSPELTERVRAAMLQLNYQPDAVARSLRRRETMTLGLLIPSVEIPFFASVAYGIERAAAARGYNIILCNSNWQHDIEVLHLQDLVARRVDGLICISSEISSAEIAPLISSGTPVVMFEEPMPGTDLDVIGIDNWKGAYDATRHLVDLGHRCIAVISGFLGVALGEERLRGYREAMRDAELPLHPSLVYQGDYLPGAGRKAVAHFFAQPEQPTAILAFNDLMALGALQALSDRGLRVPADVAVVGFDDIPLSMYTNPALTTVSQPLTEMCEAAIVLLLRRIRDDGPVDSQHIMLQPELVIRSSTARGTVAIYAESGKEVVYAQSD